MHKSCEIENCQDIAYFILEETNQLLCDYHNRNIEGEKIPLEE